MTRTPESLGLDATDPEQTYFEGDGYVRCWIGSKWDIVETAQERFAVYRKGNWRITVGTLDLALAIVADNEAQGAETEGSA